MALFDNALELIRVNLETIEQGGRAKPIVIGRLTDEQRDAINTHRIAFNPKLSPIIHEVIFVGSHVYRSRVVGDHYTIEDVLDQIQSAMAEDAEFVGGIPMQTLSSIHPRADRLGNPAIRDRAVFECTARRPSAELFSVIPKGDKIKPQK